MPAACVSRSLRHLCLPLDLPLGLPLSLGVPRQLEQPLPCGPVPRTLACAGGCVMLRRAEPLPHLSTLAPCTPGTVPTVFSAVGLFPSFPGRGPSPSVPLHTLTLQRKGDCRGGEKRAPLFWHPRKDKIDAALRCSSSGHVLQCQSTASPRRAVML